MVTLTAALYTTLCCGKPAMVIVSSGLIFGASLRRSSLRQPKPGRARDAVKTSVWLVLFPLFRKTPHQGVGHQLGQVALGQLQEPLSESSVQFRP